MKFKTGLIAVFLLCLVLTACSKKSTELDNAGSSEGKALPNAANGESATEISLSDFFLEDGAKAHYEGQGNEYAELDVNISRPYENYVVVYEDNGGVLTRNIYRIEPQNILLVSTSTASSKQDYPSQDELDATETINVYLKTPFEKGAEFNGWTITEIDIAVETPYKKFEHAMVIENKGEDFINRKYFVEGYGEVKRESIMSVEGEEEFVVTSTLKAIDK